jgi:hypothetical protein
MVTPSNCPGANLQDNFQKQGIAGVRKFFSLFGQAAPQSLLFPEEIWVDASNLINR